MARRSSLHVRRAELEDLEEVADVLADAFSDYAWTRWTVDGRDHRSRIKGLQRLVLERVALPHGQVWVASTASRVEAAAIWTDSRCPPPEQAWTGIAAERRSLEGNRHVASRSADEVVSHLRPEVPHLHLGAVGTATTSQRQGFGTAVLGPVLAAADEERVHAFLETSSEPNVRFYERLGFHVVGEAHIPGGPPVWGMLRPPG